MTIFTSKTKKNISASDQTPLGFQTKIKTIFLLPNLLLKNFTFYTRAADYINFSSRGICFLFADVFFRSRFLKNNNKRRFQRNSAAQPVAGPLKVLFKVTFHG